MADMIAHYRVLFDEFVNLDALGFGDELLVEFDKEHCKLHILIFEESRIVKEITVDLTVQ